MKKIILIFSFFILCGQNLFAGTAFDFKISNYDFWGMPTITLANGNELTGGNAIAWLYQVYSSPDFDAKKQTILQSQDSDDLLVLCQIWHHIMPPRERELFGDEMIEKITGISLKSKNVDQILKEYKKIEDAKEVNLRSITSDFLRFIAMSKSGAFLPVPKLSPGQISASLAYLNWVYSIKLGDEELIFHTETMSAATTMIACAKLKNADFLKGDRFCAQQMLLREHNLPGWKYSRVPDEVIEILGENSQSVRLLKAIISHRENPVETEIEIEKLADDFFVPAYGFMEKICHAQQKPQATAYYHYLKLRSPVNGYNYYLDFVATRSENAKILDEFKLFLDDLIAAEMFDEATEYAAFLRAKSAEFKPALSAELTRAIDEKLAKIGRKISFKQIQKYRKNPVYQNEIFEARYAEALKRAGTRLSKSLPENLVPAKYVPEGSSSIF